MENTKTLSDVAQRFLKYVQIDTTADPASETVPSSAKQLDLGKLLVTELHEMGIANAHMDTYGYVYATLEGNVANVPSIAFCSHMDTAPDCSGTGVKPIVHYAWDGNPIVLPDDETVVISAAEHPYLQNRIGDDIITASGTTLLGADDKAGIAIIMSLAKHYAENPTEKRPTLSIVFTPDEEIGRGVDHIDLTKLPAQYAYTFDGGERGTIEGENFSADGCTIVFNGVSAHPGYAFGKLVNAQKVLATFINLLPADLSPEATQGRAGFVHPVQVTGGLEQATVAFIVRDFDTQMLEQHHATLQALAAKAVAAWPGSSYTFSKKEQYRNMKTVLEQYPLAMEKAIAAYEAVGLKAECHAIRGGTDGARLSFMGLPCPNLFTGEMGIHSKQEYVSIQDMEQAVAVGKALVDAWAATAL